ncbi:MAG: DUF1801 domain-containing protein [Dermatophilaceae bacterium]
MAAKKQVSGIAEDTTAYLEEAPAAGQQRYALVRSAVLRQVGEGQVSDERVGERLSYKMPTFFVDGRVLLHVGLWTDHVAIYPVPESATDASLADDLEPYRKSKGTLHFRYADTWPADLVDRIIAAHLARLGG